MKINKICVYCASSATVNKIYFEATEKMAKELVSAEIEIIFGGGGMGLMGKLTDCRVGLKHINYDQLL